MAKMTREQCVKAAMKAGAATEATANRIVDDLLKEAAALRQQGMTSAKDLSAAWDRRMDAELRKAVRERRLADLHIIRRSQFAEHVDAIREGNPDLKFENVILAALQGEGKPTPGGRASVASYLAGVQRDTIVPMLRALHEMNDGLTLERFARDRDFEMTVVRELYGEKTGDAEAAKVAKVVADTLEEARQRFNATGGDMGRLSGGWAPQTHDRRKVAQAGDNSWASFILPLLDEERTFGEAIQRHVDENGEFARPVDRSDFMMSMLRDIHSTVVMGDSLWPGMADPLGAGGAKDIAVQGSNMANGSINEHRVLHFKDAKSAMTYHEKFGEGNVLDNVMDRLEEMTRRTAMLETLGPNPAKAVEWLIARERERIRGEIADMETVARQEKAHASRKKEPEEEAPSWMQGKEGGYSTGTVKDGETTGARLRREQEEALQQKIRQMKIRKPKGDEWKIDSLRELDGAMRTGFSPGGSIHNTLAELMGETRKVVNPTMAHVAAIARTIQVLSKLGSATLSAIADPFMKVFAMRHNGATWAETVNKGLGDYLRGVPEGERARIAGQAGAFLDRWTGALLMRWDADKSLRGTLARWQNLLFKYTGLNWITSTGKAGYTLWLSEHMGKFAGKTLEEMSAVAKGAPDGAESQFLAMLRRHGVDERKWDLWRKMMFTDKDGTTYFVPGDGRHLLKDADVEHLLSAGLLDYNVSRKERSDAGLKPYTEEQWKEGRAREIRSLKDRTRAEALGLIIDETQSAILEPDIKTQAVMRQGQAAGTWTGELMRCMWQFKSFPLAYIFRILQGRRWARGSTAEQMRGWSAGEGVGRNMLNVTKDALGKDLPGIIAFTMMAVGFGYAAMTLKDLSKGRSPRDPRKKETMIAACLQSGGLGLFGDFLFGTENRFGNQLSDTILGPAISSALEFGPVFGAGIRGEWGRAGENLFTSTLNNAPFVNVWMTRGALNYLLLYNFREMMNPGTLRRMEQGMLANQGQTFLPFLPRPSEFIRHGGGYRHW